MRQGLAKPGWGPVVEEAGRHVPRAPMGASGVGQSLSGLLVSATPGVAGADSANPSLG